MMCEINIKRLVKNLFAKIILVFISTLI